MSALFYRLGLWLVRLSGHVPQPPITVWYYGPYLSPHPARKPVLHVDCATEAEAWRAIEEVP